MRREQLAEPRRANEERIRERESAQLVAGMGSLLIDAVMAANRLAAVKRNVYRPEDEYPRVSDRELAKALLLVLQDGAEEPSDLNEMGQIFSLYRFRSPARWIEAFGWLPRSRED